MARTLFDRSNGFLPVETLIERVALEIISAGNRRNFGFMAAIHSMMSGRLPFSRFL